MTLERDFGGLEMGLFRKKKENVDGEPTDPGRRLWMKRTAQKTAAVAGGAIALQAMPYLKAVGLGVDEAEAAPKSTYKSPGAIAAEPDERLRHAWRLYHDKKKLEYMKEDPMEEAAIMLRMREEPGPKVSDETFNTSFGYRLLLAKMPRRYGHYPGMVPEENVGLKHFACGVGNLFRQQNRSARRDFARGIFTSANLGPNDYKTLERLGIDVKYDKGADMSANALNLANIFVNENLARKERMLRVVADKFKGVKANNAATNWNSPEYQMKGVFWNLGFYITSEFAENNDKLATKMRNDHSLSYRRIRKQMGVNYNTANGILLKT